MIGRGATAKCAETCIRLCQPLIDDGDFCKSNGNGDTSISTATPTSHLPRPVSNKISTTVNCHESPLILSSKLLITALSPLTDFLLRPPKKPHRQLLSALQCPGLELLDIPVRPQKLASKTLRVCTRTPNRKCAGQRCCIFETMLVNKFRFF